MSSFANSQPGFVERVEARLAPFWKSAGIPKAHKTILANVFRQALAEVLAESRPRAWLHILDNTDGIPGNTPREVATLDAEPPFGRAGIDFSETYQVTSEPLFTHPAPSELAEASKATNPAEQPASMSLREKIISELAASSELRSSYEETADAILAAIASEPAASGYPCSMGVGNGGGNLFVHGEYDSIKAAQAIVLENSGMHARIASLETELADKADQLDGALHNWQELKAERDAMRKDAERYQAVKRMSKEQLCFWRGAYACSDESIDAAIAAQTGDTKGGE